MEIKPVEIQNLLLNLVDALTPIAKEGPSKEARFLGRRIFSSPQRSTPNPEAHLLTRLQTAQKQMMQWIQSDVRTEGKELRGIASPAKGGLSKTSSPSISLISQARDLLFQVRSVINTLSTSSRLGKLEEGVLDDETIGRLKSLVERLIETVKRKETDASGNRAPPSLPRPLPTSPREHLLKKSIPLPSFPDAKEKPLPKAARSPEKDSLSSHKEPTKMKEELLLKPLLQPKGDQSKPLPSAERTSLPSAPYPPEKLFSKLLKKKKKKRSDDDEEEEKSR